jgi:hypothetical protein
MYSNPSLLSKNYFVLSNLLEKMALYVYFLFVFLQNFLTNLFPKKDNFRKYFCKFTKLVINFATLPAFL